MDIGVKHRLCVLEDGACVIVQLVILDHYVPILVWTHSVEQ